MTNTKTTETRVYLIDLSNDTSGVEIGNWNNLSNEKWIELSEMQGSVYSLDGFQKQFNNELIGFETYIRFIQVPIY